MMAGKQVKRRIFEWGLAWGLLWLCVLGAANAMADPTPQEILAGARLNESGQHRVLDGHLRQGPLVVPFRLTFDGNVIRYDFSNPAESYVVQLGDEGSRLEDVTASGEKRVSQSQLADKVRGTEITYEDIALKFLYWPKAILRGEDTMLTRRCWKLLVQPATPAGSQYGTVILWVEKESGAFLQADAYDRAAKLVKRFKVVSAQRVDGEWILKKMRIERMDSDDDEPTYLEIDKEESRGGGGPNG
jgi:hypothetical protein